MQRAYAQALRWPEERIHMVPNGYDEADFSGDVAPIPRARPVMLYCGRFGEVAGRDPGLLLRAARMLRDRGVDFTFHIVGDNSASLREQIAALDLASTVKVRGVVPHAEAIREIRGADVLVLSQPNARHRISSVAGKTFEYLRSGQPILAVVPPGDNADLVRAYAPVHEVVTSFELDDVANAMESCVRQVGRAPGHATRPEDAFSHRHERRALTGRLAAIFERAAGASSA
jgi:glycosyltransferase involved in cell wall biosynthesis